MDSRIIQPNTGYYQDKPSKKMWESHKFDSSTNYPRKQQKKLTKTLHFNVNDKQNLCYSSYQTSKGQKSMKSLSSLFDKNVKMTKYETNYDTKNFNKPKSHTKSNKTLKFNVQEELPTKNYKQNFDASIQYKSKNYYQTKSYSRVKLNTEACQVEKYNMMKSNKSEKRIKFDQISSMSNHIDRVEQNVTKSSKKIDDAYQTYVNKSSKKIQTKVDSSLYSKIQSKKDLFSSKSMKNINFVKKDTQNQIDYEKQKITEKSYTLLPQPNKISINDFSLGKCTGQGAFGQVFPAIHKSTKMLVAIKKVPKEKVKYMIDQFVNQIKIQMYLNHQNIVKLYGFFDDKTHFYIIMEYMEGGSLFSHVKKNKKMSELEAKEKLRQVCLGLKQMHDNSILHRDIKPENIVLTNNVCKLCDFGWSAILTDRRTTYCGTLDYISPEIIGGQDYDDSVDIWCIGVLAFELICGKTPFYNISKKETMNKIMNVNYDFPKEVSQDARRFIDNILKKDPNERVGIDEVLKTKFLK